ncbi:MAG: hypothetical protein ACD_73C00100G0003 [uncultured bacterium]|nr:MAG: hypothetical protein ACD_73C00100G0003 [uncultured bacterium]
MRSQTNITVRFSDCDPIGHVNNATYFTYFEQSRVDLVRKLFNINADKNMRWQDFPFIIAEISCKFLKPTFPDQKLIVTAIVGEVKNSSFYINYELNDKATQELVATGSSVLVWYDYQKAQSVRIPDIFRERLTSKE